MNDESRPHLEPMDLWHVPAMAALEARCFSEPWSEEAFYSEAENPHALYLVAVQGEAVQGFAGMHVVLDEGYITNVAVDANLRRRGVGRLLLEGLIATGHKKKLAFLTLEVRQSNTPAISLYKAMGFYPVGLRKNFYRLPTEDALLMTCTLTGQNL